MHKKILSMHLIFIMQVISNSEVYFYELYVHNEIEEIGKLSKQWTGYTSVNGSHYSLTTRTENRFSWNGINALKIGYYHAWIELIMGVGKEWITACTKNIVKKNHGGLDDFLFDMGYNFFFHHKHGQIIPHIIVGIPLHWKVTHFDVLEPLVGSRFFSFGPSIDILYKFIREPYHELFFTFILRFLHQCERQFYPVYPCGDKYFPGNSTDALWALHYRYATHDIEVGYSANFLTNQHLESIHFKNNIYSWLYGYYVYTLPHVPLNFGVGTAYSWNSFYSLWKVWATAGLQF